VNWKRYLRIMSTKAKKRNYHHAFQKRWEGLPLTEEEAELLKRPVDAKGIKDMTHELRPPMETTYDKRHETTFRELAGLLRGRKKVIVNDIGYGEPGFSMSRTKQPWDLIDTLEKSGTGVDYWGYDYYPLKAKITEKQKPEKYKEKTMFGSMDIVTATPSRKADVTVFLNVKYYLTKDEKEVAVKHIVDSTKKGGYIVTDVEPNKIEDKRIKLEKRVEEEKTHRIKYIYKRIK